MEETPELNLIEQEIAEELTAIERQVPELEKFLEVRMQDGMKELEISEAVRTYFPGVQSVETACTQNLDMALWWGDNAEKIHFSDKLFGD